jgi:hypothetical protein
MSTADRRRILDEARQTLVRSRETLADAAGRPVVDKDQDPPPLRYRTMAAPPPEPSPKPAPKLDTADASWWENWLASRLNARLAVEREAMASAVGEELADMLDAERAEHRAELETEIKNLRLELDGLVETVNDLRAVISLERGSAPVDLPNPLSPRRVN